MEIAMRVLKLRRADGEMEIPVSVMAPEQSGDRVWFCHYQIGWPEGRRESRAGGVDSIQALLLALQMIGSEIYTSSYHKSGQLYLDAPGRGYGFPVPNNIRDLLIGDDKRFL